MMAVQMGITTEQTNMSRYPSLWLILHRERVVTVAPLWGRESRPPEEMEATRWSTSGPMPILAPASIRYGS